VAVQGESPDGNKVEIKTTRLSDDFYTLEAQGSSIPVGTVSVLTGPDGVLIVDSQSKDEFCGGGLVTVFRRDAAGKVVGSVLFGQRARGMQFDRTR